MGLCVGGFGALGERRLVVGRIFAQGNEMDPIGRKRWAIAEGYIPSQSSFSDRALISHETACILNAADEDAHVRITVFFADREAIGPYRVTVGARRTLHCAAHASRFASRGSQFAVDDGVQRILKARRVHPPILATAKRCSSKSGKKVAFLLFFRAFLPRLRHCGNQPALKGLIKRANRR
jgi:hypothetical protein